MFNYNQYGVLIASPPDIEDTVISYQYSASDNIEIILHFDTIQQAEKFFEKSIEDITPKDLMDYQMLIEETEAENKI